MQKKHITLTRRKFMLASSAVATTPFLADLTSAKAASAAAPLSIPKGSNVYFIGRGCIGCQVCRTFCPAKAIHYGDGANEIDQSKCIHCGTCYAECPNCVITRTVN